MGFGTDSVVEVSCDKTGAMDPENLDRKLQKITGAVSSITAAISHFDFTMSN